MHGTCTVNEKRFVPSFALLHYIIQMISTHKEPSKFGGLLGIE